ncbi:MAG: hypothetical protein GY702_22760 [Desulfobulbaceae bacterium]|nr:hypothetical protein [Desulfobulbaceae bacterium]
MPTLTIKMKLPFVIEKEGEVYVGHCPVFDVYSQGCTAKEAELNTIEAVQVFVQTCIEMGTINQVMQESGFIPACQIKEDPSEENLVDVVLPYIASQNLSGCHV